MFVYLVKDSELDIHSKPDYEYYDNLPPIECHVTRHTYGCAIFHFFFKVSIILYTLMSYILIILFGVVSQCLVDPLQLIICNVLWLRVKWCLNTCSLGPISLPVVLCLCNHHVI